MASPAVQDSDWFSLSLLSVLRVFRSVAAGFINLMFPYFVLVELYPNSNEGVLVLGLVYTVATLASAGLGMLLGFAADLVGRKSTFLVALAMLPMSTALLMVSRALPVVFLAAAVGGYSATGSLAGGGVGGIAAPIQSALMTDLTARKDRTFLFGLLAFVSGLAAAAGAFGAGFLPTSSILLVATVLGALSFAVGLFLRDRAEPKRGQRMRTRKVIGQFSLTGILNGVSQGLLTPFLIPFFILVYAVPKETMGLYTTVSGIIASFALLAAPWIEKALGFLGSIYATRGGTVLIALAFPFVRLLPVSLAFYFAFPSLRVMAVPVQQSAMMDMVGEGERGRAFGINQGFRLLFSSAGTGFTGYEFNADLIYVPFLAYAVAMTANLALYHRFFKGYRSPLSRPESAAPRPDTRGSPGPADPPPPPGRVQ